MTPFRMQISEVDMARFLYLAAHDNAFDRSRGVFRNYIDYLRDKRIGQDVGNMNNFRFTLARDRPESYAKILKIMERAIEIEMLASIRNNVEHNQILAIKDHLSVALRYMVWLHRLLSEISNNRILSFGAYTYSPLDLRGDLNLVASYLSNTGKRIVFGVSYSVVSDRSVIERILIVNFNHEMQTLMKEFLKTIAAEQTTESVNITAITTNLNDKVYSGLVRTDDEIELTTFRSNDPELKFYVMKDI